MSGSKIPAEQGALTFLLGGDKAILKDEGVQADLAAMGKASYMLGKVGAGTRMKLVVYMVKGEMMASLAEGLALAGAAGLEQKAMLEILGQWVGVRVRVRVTVRVRVRVGVRDAAAAPARGLLPWRHTTRRLGAARATAAAARAGPHRPRAAPG